MSRAPVVGADERSPQFAAMQSENIFQSETSSRFVHDFSQVPVGRARGFSFDGLQDHQRRDAADAGSSGQLESAGSVRDQDASAALNGLDVEPEAPPMPPVAGTEEAPQEAGLEAEPGDEGEAEPLQKKGEAAAETSTPAEGAKEGESADCASPSDHAGILALLTKAGAPKPRKTLAYGFTFWAKSGIVRPKVEFDWKSSGKKWTGTVKKTTTSMGKVEALYLKPGTYMVPEKITARGPKCGPSGKKVHFYSKIDKDISALAKQAEEEHCSDYGRAFDLTYGKWAGLINSIAGTTFGPGSKAQVRSKAANALKAKGDKGRDGWIAESNRLKSLSTQRDASDHRMKADGDPVKVDEACTRVDGVSVKSATTKIPGPSSASLIK